MPCNDGMGPGSRVEYVDTPATLEKVAWLEAALCMVIRAWDQSMQSEQLDFKGAGLDPNQFKAWWEKHKKRDDARRAREAKEAKQKQRRDAEIAREVLLQAEILKKARKAFTPAEMATLRTVLRGDRQALQQSKEEREEDI